MEVRPIRADECDTLGRITVEAYRGLTGGSPLGPYEDVLSAVSAHTSDCVVLVALDDLGVLLGGVTYVPNAETSMSEFTDPEAAGIRLLAVQPQHQGSGAGRALTEACIARAHAEGRRRILLHSTHLMTVARSMYERLGFVEFPQLDVWVTEPPYSTERPLRLIAYAVEI